MRTDGSRRMNPFIVKGITGLWVVFLFSGCAMTSAVDKINEDLHARHEQRMSYLNAKKADIDVRRGEIEEAYKAGKLSDAEYLILKNQLEVELQNLIANAQREIDHDERIALGRIRSLSAN